MHIFSWKCGKSKLKPTTHAHPKTETCDICAAPKKGNAMETKYSNPTHQSIYSYTCCFHGNFSCLCEVLYGAIFFFFDSNSANRSLTQEILRKINIHVGAD